MSLTSTDLARLARLAQLEFSPAEGERLLPQINSFFDIVGKMRAVNTECVTPLAHPVAAIQDIHLRLRPDLASEPNQREANQANAPCAEQGLFLVPQVIES